MNVVAFVFARGGSKGVHRKNIRLLHGKPLIAHSIDVAQQCPSISRVVVSTDDAEIAETALRFGAEVPFLRPADLAQDNTSEWLAWRHALYSLRSLGGEKTDVFVSLPPTSPLRVAADVESCISAYLDDKPDMVITVTPARRNPYFNMVMVDESFTATPVMSAPAAKPLCRQEAPTIYDMTTVAYVANPDFVLSASGIFNGSVRAVVVPPERALDIDTELEFRFAEFCLAQSHAHKI